jgi:hypothetical protein
MHCIFSLLCLFRKKKKKKMADEITLCLCPQHLKATTVEPEDMTVNRQQLGKHVPAAMNIHADRAISYTQCAVKGDWAITSEENFPWGHVVTVASG